MKTFDLYAPLSQFPLYRRLEENRLFLMEWRLDLKENCADRAILYAKLANTGLTKQVRRNACFKAREQWGIAFR